MNKKHILSILVAGTALATSCNSGDIRRNPGKTYVPDMVYSRAYDAYTAGPEELGNQTSLQPVKGTIARGHALPTHLTAADSQKYYAINPTFKFNEFELVDGQRKYEIFCGVCHGTALDGQGPLFTSGKYASMPASLISENYINFTPGKIYYAIMYGKNMMGSYASQLNEEDRWKIVAYIKKVQSEKGGAAFTMGSTGTQDAVVTTTVAATEDTTQATH